jgi:hypothetical protein
VGVKNDEQLIKMATIVQRALNNSTGGDGDGFGMSEAEKTQLLEQIQNYNSNN